jgi:hypothetical protein
MTRLALFLLISLAGLVCGHIQASAQGQLPGTLPPAPPVVVPPPPVAPPQVPSVVAPLLSPRYGIPPGVAGSAGSPTYGSGGSVILRAKPPKRRFRPKRPRRSSEILFFQTI